MPARSGVFAVTIASWRTRPVSVLPFRSSTDFAVRQSGSSARRTSRDIKRQPTMSEHAVILAGGKGTRLRPYTVVLPKPLMPLGEYPILEVLIRQLAGCGFKEITLAVNHQANIIKAFCGDGAPWGVRIQYSLETKPLSTIAPLRLMDSLPENFLLLNGDVLTDLDLKALYCKHVAERRLFTIASAVRTHRIDYGVLHVDSG